MFVSVHIYFQFFLKIISCQISTQFGMGSYMQAPILGFLCQMCTEVERHVIHLYGERARHLQLVEKMEKYLSIRVCQSDPLPKTICKFICNVAPKQEAAIKPGPAAPPPDWTCPWSHRSRSCPAVRREQVTRADHRNLNTYMYKFPFEVLYQCLFWNQRIFYILCTLWSREMKIIERGKKRGSLHWSVDC